MAYESTGLGAMYPVYLARRAEENEPREDYDIRVAQNELNMNQNFEMLSGKLTEIESFLAEYTKKQEESTI